MSEFKRCIGSDIEVCTVMTSCYSGGWTVHPSLNITAITAAGPNEVSGSWNASASVGRKCGSIYATAVTEVLVREEEIPESSSLVTDQQVIL
jgi:hypothetical protein